MSGDYDRIGEVLVKALKTGTVLLVVFVPLGLWKLVELVIWCWRHWKL